MFDILVKGGKLPDGRVADIGIEKDRIKAIGQLDAEAGEVIDAAGDLVAPPFVDPHFHLDATLSYGTPRINASGTLLEGIGLWSELKEVMTEDEMIERALTYCDWAASMGLLAIRSHVDTCDDSLKGVRAMLEVREQVKDYIDLQLVAFPQKLQLCPAVAGCPGAGFGANNLAACFLQLRLLDIEVLAGRADAGVSDPGHGQSVTLRWLIL